MVSLDLIYWLPFAYVYYRSVGGHDESCGGMEVGRTARLPLIWVRGSSELFEWVEGLG